MSSEWHDKSKMTLEIAGTLTIWGANGGGVRMSGIGGENLQIQSQQQQIKSDSLSVFSVCT